jgi:GNAT superfamily N-acetyltransferase
MILPNGYSDVPAGKIAAIVTHLEMTARPALRPDPAGVWSLRPVDAPALDWFRDLYRRVGEQWLWFSRLQMTDAELAAIIQSPLVEIYALVHDGREGLLELDFREAGQCKLVFFGVTEKLIGSGAARWLMNRALERAGRDRSRASGCILAPSITRPRWRSINGQASGRSGGRSKSRMIRGSTGPRRVTRRSIFRLFSNRTRTHSQPSSPGLSR